MNDRPSVAVRRSLVVDLTLAAVAVVVAVFAAESALRWLVPYSSRHFVLPPNQVSTFVPQEQYMPGVSGAARHVTSSLGIRGEEFSNDVDEYRILAIGGSTTQNVYLDQSETWTLLAGQLLGPTASGAQTWTGDVARSGHTARSHVLQFEILIPELPEIDAVVMLVGVNDLTAALSQGMNYSPPPPLSDPAARRAQLRGAFVQVPGRFHQRQTLYQSEVEHPIKRLALYQLGSRVKTLLSGALRQDRVGEVYRDWRAYRQQAPRIIDAMPDLADALAVYRGYLEALADLSREYGVRLVFMTQPSLWRADLSPEEEAALWLGGIGEFQLGPGHEYFSSGVLARGMDAYNATLLAVCSKRSLECLDLAAKLPKDLSVFYDDVHLTELGSRQVAEHLAEFLSRRPPYSVADGDR